MPVRGPSLAALPRYTPRRVCRTFALGDPGRWDCGALKIRMIALNCCRETQVWESGCGWIEVWRSRIAPNRRNFLGRKCCCACWWGTRIRCARNFLTALSGEDSCGVIRFLLEPDGVPTRLICSKRSTRIFAATRYESFGVSLADLDRPSCAYLRRSRPTKCCWMGRGNARSGRLERRWRAWTMTATSLSVKILCELAPPGNQCTTYASTALDSVIDPRLSGIDQALWDIRERVKCTGIPAVLASLR